MGGFVQGMSPLLSIVLVFAILYTHGKFRMDGQSLLFHPHFTLFFCRTRRILFWTISVRNKFIFFLIWQFVLVSEIGASSTRNIAFRQPVYAPCEHVSSEGNFITDGISNPMNSLLVSSDCSTPSLVRIKIVIPPTKMIGSVIAFSGDCPDCGRVFLFKIVSRIMIYIVQSAYGQPYGGCGH